MILIISFAVRHGFFVFFVGVNEASTTNAKKQKQQECWAWKLEPQHINYNA